MTDGWFDNGTGGRNDRRRPRRRGSRAIDQRTVFVIVDGLALTLIYVDIEGHRNNHGGFDTDMRNSSTSSRSAFSATT